VPVTRHTKTTTGCDTIIIGGGLLGCAIAIGLAKRGHCVSVLDGGDSDLRASRGNFGLTWVQGKGAGNASYARWTGSAVKQWPDFARELLENTGIDVGFEQNGGLDFCLTQAEWQSRAEIMKQVKQHTVFGASFSPHDGHVNPLKLLRALHIYMRQLGCKYRPNRAVVGVQRTSNGFMINTQRESYRCDKLVFCAGLSNTELAKKIGLSIPVHANQGQLLITERVPKFLKYPSIHIRQTDEGTLQIGDSSADVGLDDTTKLSVIADIAARLVRIFPHLSDVNVIRSWSALRVMTPDGLPIYEHAATCWCSFRLDCKSFQPQYQ